MAKVGRPSKQKNISLPQLEKMAGYGLTDEQIADILQICTATLKNYKQNPKFLTALKKGKEKADNFVVGSLFHRAIGYSHPELQLFCYKGKIIQKEIIKHYPPDPIAMIFWLKNRQPENWRDKTDIEHSVSENTVEKFAQLSDAELLTKANALIGKSNQPK